jgi:peptidyl-prolyl cis-trans isomerase D
MLESFRRGGVVQFFLGGVIVLIIAAFALDFRQPNVSLESECVVEVGHRCVPAREFTAAFQLSVRPDLTPKQLKQLQIRKMLLDGLVERELLLAEADRLGVSIGDDKVDAELALGRFHFSLPAAREGQLPMATYVNVRNPQTEAFNFEIYQRAVRNYARMSTKDFKLFQTEELIAHRMRELAKLGVRVSESEAYAMFDQSRSKATVRVGQVDTEWFARFATQLSDDATTAYAASHTGEVDAAFAAREPTFSENCALVSEIFFAFPPAADAEDEAATRTRAETAAARATKGSARDFELLARIHSAAQSASAGGRRGCIQESEGEEAVELLKAVEGLPAGGVSKLVQLPRGFHLLRVDARPSKEELAQVGRNWVAGPLAVHEQAEVLARQFVEALRSEVSAGKPMQDALDALTRSSVKAGSAALAAAPAGSVQPGEIEAAALESRARPELSISPSFTRVGIQSPIPGAPSAKQLAFTLKEVGDVYPESIPTQTGFAIMQLKDKEPAKREDFEKEKHDFMAEVTERARAEAVTAFVGRLRKAREAEITVNQRYLEEKASTEDDS